MQAVVVAMHREPYYTLAKGLIESIPEEIICNIISDAVPPPYTPVPFSYNEIRLTAYQNVNTDLLLLHADTLCVDKNLFLRGLRTIPPDCDVAVALEHTRESGKTPRYSQEEIDDYYSVPLYKHTPLFDTGIVFVRHNEKGTMFNALWHSEWTKYKKRDGLAFSRALAVMMQRGLCVHIFNDGMNRHCQKVNDAHLMKRTAFVHTSLIDPSQKEIFLRDYANERDNSDLGMHDVTSWSDKR